MALHLQDATLLVTGATDGLGRGVARAAAEAGATVLVHGRRAERTDPVVAELRGLRATVRAYHADLARLEEVRALAAAVREGEDRLDVLVNNAGIGASVPGGRDRQESPDGIELRLAVNYLAGYLLTRELLPLLAASAPARIVNVASAGQQAIDFDDPMLEHGYSGVRAYCQSKLAQIVWTADEAARLPAGVTITALHPATYMPTKIVTASPRSSLEEGVTATLRLAGDDDVEGVSGVYFDGLREERPDPQAADPEARRRLRELSERLTA
jgi:NAD(P)-dependent dehydrogenase (short-subunit alcohol dehydrogenase family)